MEEVNYAYLRSLGINQKRKSKVKKKWNFIQTLAM